MTPEKLVFDGEVKWATINPALVLALEDIVNKERVEIGKTGRFVVDRRVFYCSKEILTAINEGSTEQILFHRMNQPLFNLIALAYNQELTPEEFFKVRADAILNINDKLNRKGLRLIPILSEDDSL